jgi:predicted enzyme related to lactoylglutathione lyase
MTDLPTVTAAHHGALSWVDLSTPDIEGAVQFYAQLFGWSLASSSTPAGEYHIASIADSDVCGMMAHGDEQQGMPAMWTVFFTVGDLAATLASIDDHGGTVLQPPIEIPGGAHVAVVADPAGAVFAVISGGPHPEGAYLSGSPGAVGWVETLTRDPLAIVPFYETVFGWRAHSEEATGYTTFVLVDTEVCGMLPMPAEVPAEAPSHWATYFTVADCEIVTRRCAELGGQVHRPATSAGGIRFAVLSDPHGATFSVIEFGEAPPD